MSDDPKVPIPSPRDKGPANEEPSFWERITENGGILGAPFWAITFLFVYLGLGDFAAYGYAVVMILATGVGFFFGGVLPGVLILLSFIVSFYAALIGFSG